MVTGACLCRAVRWSTEASPSSVHYCHCTLCRRWTGSAFATLAWYPSASVRWRGMKPTVFRSSPITCSAPIHMLRLAQVIARTGLEKDNDLRAAIGRSIPNAWVKITGITCGRLDRARSARLARQGASRRIIRFGLMAVAPDESGSDLLLDSHAFTPLSPTQITLLMVTLAVGP